MYVPESLEEFVKLIRAMSWDVLSERDRERIAAVMSFDMRRVGELMVGRDKMVFVNENDLLGPLMLDKLYKSGFTNFPVVDNRERVQGVIHTEALNALEIKKTDRAKKCMERDVAYLHVNDSLEFAVEEIGRTNAFYFLVLDEKEKLAGFFTVQHLLRYLLGGSEDAENSDDAKSGEVKR
ncbi:CBS domain-containing protein [Candidatus Saccharibacteria bacterium]|nr:CBS domain-containing protein [Candidatus Saccharibacteria bacterium]